MASDEQTKEGAGARGDADTPWVTVGIPAYNSAGTIARAIRSVQAQSFRRWRLIVSDDASQDGTADLCERLIAGDPRITLVRQPQNLGYMNFGYLVGAARTPYFAWLAGDDLWHPAFLETCVAVLAARPDAVSAVPMCDFVEGAEIVPRAAETATIDGEWPARARAFLAQPNGTRMYGLFRTAVLAQCFPPRSMHAYDFALMLGVLRHGPQLGISQRLITRSRTPWEAYARSVRTLYPGRLRRALPLLDMTLLAIRRGFVPWRPALIGRLAALNAAAQEEYVFINEPALYVRLLPLYRALGLPLAQRESLLPYLGRRLLREGDAVARARGLRLLERLAEAGSAEADMMLGHHWRSQEPAEPARAARHFERAARRGAPEAGFERIATEAVAAGPAPLVLAAHYAAEARRGSGRAAAELGRLVCAGHAGIDLAEARTVLEAFRPDGRPVVLRALGRLAEDGLGAEQDGDLALGCYLAAAATDPRAAREVGRLVLDEGERRSLEEAEYWYHRAATEGDPWALRDLAGRVARRGDAAAAAICRRALARTGMPEVARAIAGEMARLAALRAAEPVEAVPACAAGTGRGTGRKAARSAGRMTGRDGMRNLVVWGVHRSGTSVVAQALEAMGWYLGRVNRARTAGNPDGYFENLALVDIDERLLAAQGLSWSNWAVDPSALAFEAGSSDPFRRMATALLDDLEREGETAWALKDPRMATLAGFWAPILRARAVPPRHILVLRAPSAVAASQVARALHDPAAHRLLQRREAMLVLWASNTLNVLRALHAEEILLLPHADLARDPRTALARVAAFAGAPAGPVDAAGVFKAEHVHSVPPTAGEEGIWDAMAARLFGQLADRADAPMRPDDTGKIVRQNAELAQALAVLQPFSGLLAAIGRGEGDWFARNTGPGSGLL
jgi:TPR repeat protein